MSARRRPAPWCALIVLLLAVPIRAADLRPETVAAFDRYVRATEARIAAEVADPGRFVLVDDLPASVRAARLDQLRDGQVVIERLETRNAGAKIPVPDGLIHHWVGLAFVRGATVNRAVALLQDYNHHADIYRPGIAGSKLLSHDGDDFRLFLRFYMKKVISVTVNSEHEAHFTRPGPDRAYSRIVSTRIAEVDRAGTPQESEKPVGHDSGFMWRLNTYWRFLERDGGTYVQCESITLSRRIPLGFGWLIGPFVTGIPRESLTFMLERTRRELASPANPAGP